MWTLLAIAAVTALAVPYATHSVYDPRVDWPKDCSSPTRLYYVSRHGIREPGHGLMERMRSLKLRITAAGDSVSPMLRDFDPEIQFGSAADRLVDRGIQELESAGKRMRARFSQPPLVSQVSLRSTSVPRAARSGLAFSRGFLGADAIPFCYMVPELDDHLLRPFQSCIQYLDEIQTGRFRKQQNLFVQRYFTTLASQLTTRCGFNLEITDVKTFWDIAAFQVAVLNISNGGFANLFNSEDVSMLNFYEDLGYYYKRGYGAHPAINRLATTLMEDVKSFFAENNQVAWLRFAHAETIMPLFVKLGLYRDIKPLQNSVRNETRLWKTSEISPFEANVAFYEASCLGGNKSIVLQVNEKTVGKFATIDVFLNSLDLSNNCRFLSVVDSSRWSSFEIGLTTTLAAICVIIAVFIIVSFIRRGRSRSRSFSTSRLLQRESD